MVAGSSFGGEAGADAAAAGLGAGAGEAAVVFLSPACLSLAALFAGFCPCFDRIVFLSRPHVPHVSCHAG